MQILQESLRIYIHHHCSVRNATTLRIHTFFTMGDAPNSGIKRTVDKNSSKPLRRFSRNAGRYLAVSSLASQQIRDIQTTDLGGKAGINFWYLGNAEQRFWRRLKNSEYRLRVLRICPWSYQAGTTHGKYLECFDSAKPNYRH